MFRNSITHHISEFLQPLRDFRPHTGSYRSTLVPFSLVFGSFWLTWSTTGCHALEVTTRFKNFKYRIEIRIWSVGQDNSHSWVRISYGTNKYVIHSNYNNTEFPADLLEEQASQSSVKVVAARSKAQAKPLKRETVELPSTIPMNERKWMDIEPSEPLSLRTRSRSK